MSAFDRRSFLIGSGAALTAAALAGCGSDSTAGSAAAGGQLRWWDHFSALQKLNKDWAAKQSTAIGKTVTYTYTDASKLPEALQLAKQGNQLPDVFTNVLNLPLAALVEGGWLGELQISDQERAALPKGTLTEGLTMLDGKVYSLPLFAWQQYAAAMWFNADLYKAAGLDPAAPPKTYDEYRQTLEKLKSAKGGVAPMILALGGTARMREQIDDLAQAAGFPGYQGMRFRDGQYAYDDDTYVNAIEFWKELNSSGLILAGSGSLTVANARSRWGAGAAVFFPDGPWCAGGVRNVAPGFEKKIDVGPLLVPQAGTTPVTYRGAPTAQFFVSKTTSDAAAASKLVSSFTTDEYRKGLAAGMDQPPIDLSVVKTADVIEPYRKLVGWFSTTVRRGPEAVVRNPQVAKAQAAAKPISPDLGNIIQGYLGGDVTDLRAALKQLSASFTADRERAIGVATKAGAKVSLSDYAFPDWKPGVNYTYKA